MRPNRFKVYMVGCELTKKEEKITPVPSHLITFLDKNKVYILLLA